MKLERVEPSKRKAGRVLVYLEDGTLLRCTERELLSFGLRAGDELDAAALKALKEAAAGSGTREEAAALIGRRAMSRADLVRKLRERGASCREADAAAEWLEAIGALNDADYAAALVRRCAGSFYGPARCREELRRHGIDRNLWDEALAAAPSPQELIGRYLTDRFRARAVDALELRRASDALARRGFSWADVRPALAAYTDDLPEE